MKLQNWLIILFSLILLSIKLDGVKASRLSFGLAYNRFYSVYCSFFSQYVGNEFLKLLPATLVSSLASVKDLEEEQENNISTTVILEDNKELQLGDVLINREGEIFFFMSATKKDAVISTLMRASNGLCEINHEINLFTLIKKYENESVSFLDHGDDADVRDQFRVIQDYGEFTLLQSTCHSIVFVAPSAEIDEFIRGEFQKRIKGRFGRDRANSKDSMEKKAKNEEGGLISILKKSDSFDEFLMSPDSIDYPGLLDNLSHIEILFGTYDNSSTLRLKFIRERFVTILLGDELDLKDAFVLIKKAAEVFRRNRTVEFIKVNSGESITVVGDIHGQFEDLLRIFKNRGWPSETKKYLFNGDIVDRGRESIQCLLLLYALKISFPESVFINRGNHETEMCGIGTFYKDTHELDPSGDLFRSAQKGFVALPLAHVINDRIYVVHGGIRAEYSIVDLCDLDRYSLNQFANDFLVASLWDDSSELIGVRNNPSRGPSSRLFGPDVTQAFLEMNELNLLIRSHTYIENGIELSQNGNCLTIFSAPNYCGMGNVAAVVTYDSNLQPEFSYFKAKSL